MPLELGQLFVDSGSCKRTSLPFNRTPRLQQLERTNVGLSRMAPRRLLGDDVNPRSLADINQAIELERDDCLTDSGPGDRVGACKFAL